MKTISINGIKRAEIFKRMTFEGKYLAMAKTV
jgi:hypothetical protein